MGKLGIAAIATGVGGASGIYGAHSLGVFGGREAGGKGWDIPAGIYQEKTDNVNKCLKDIFQDWTPTSNTPSTVESVSNIPWSGTDATNACLIYNWKKEKQSGDWAGSNFRLVWALSKGDSGVVVDLNATVKNSTSMEFKGFSYILRKENSKWRAINKLGLKGGNKIINLGEWKSTFPKLEQTDFSNKQTPAYWGFLNVSGDKMETAGDQSSQQWWKWNNTIHGFYQLKNWSSNFDVWWEYFFGKDRLNMKQLMGDITGNWSA